MNKSLKLSQHFTLGEFTVSSNGEARGIVNEPSDKELKNLYRLAEFMESIRELLGNTPISPTSVFRNREINKLAGSSNTSHHRLGRAIDFFHSKYSTKEVMDRIVDSQLMNSIDQIIIEERRNNNNVTQWIHISIPEAGVKPRMEKLSCLNNRYTWYNAI